MSERFFPDGMPPPMVDSITLPWWRAAAEHRLLVQSCMHCQHTQLPPAPLCSVCRSQELDWREVSGRGALYTYTQIHRPVAAGQDLPFTVAVIALEDSGGVRMISNLVEAEVQSLKIGLAVELVWEDMGPELALPRFRPLRS